MRKTLADRDHETFSLTRQATLLGISRGSLYTTPTPLSAEDLALHKAIDRIYTDAPFFGQRKIRDELQTRFDISVGRDRVRSAMSFLGLEAIYPRPHTSVFHPDHRVYPYLLKGVTALYPNHIWGVDITYIPLPKGFCYLVAILDWYSRYVVSWRVAETMEAAFCIDALSEALDKAQPRFHNSDQGSQFTSTGYLDTLAAFPDIRISMDGRGRCFDNIFTERLWRSVKYENVYLNEYTATSEARAGLAEYFHFYNERRPHQALGYTKPRDVYYQNLTACEETARKNITSHISALGSLSTEAV